MKRKKLKANPNQILIPQSPPPQNNKTHYDTCWSQLKIVFGIQTVYQRTDSVILLKRALLSSFKAETSNDFPEHPIQLSSWQQKHVDIQLVFEIKQEYFYASKIGCILFLSCQSFCNSVKHFNLASYFRTVRGRLLIFHMSISSDKTFLMIPTFLSSDLDVWVWHIFWKPQPF